jgi:hypothetical protein
MSGLRKKTAGATRSVLGCMPTRSVGMRESRLAVSGLAVYEDQDQVQIKGFPAEAGPTDCTRCFQSDLHQPGSFSRASALLQWSAASLKSDVEALEAGRR